MFTDSFRERTEDDALFGKSRTEGRRDRNRVKYGIDRHSCERLALMERDAELVECLLKLRVYLLRTVLVLLRSRIIYDVLEVYLRNVKVSPLWNRHLLPAAECLQTEVQHPLRFLLLCGDQAYDVLIQTFWYELLRDISHEAVLILLLRNIIQYILTHILKLLSCNVRT